MFTRCPACQTIFRVQADTLRVAQGLVRCGRCAAQFNALDSLAEDPEALVMPAEVEAGMTAQPGVSELSAETASTETPPDQREGGVTEPAPEIPRSDIAGETQIEAPADAIDAAIPEDSAQVAETTESAGVEAPTVSLDDAMPPAVLAPGVIQEALLIDERAPRSLGPRLAGGAAILGLLALLAGQWVYLQRVPLYERPALRPALQHFCAVLGCDLPLPRMPERVEVVERVVREHPRVVRALLVDLSFVSRADQTIAYPVLEMRLSDVSGNRVAARRFAPIDYLPPGVDIQAGMQPGQPVLVTLELVEPQIEAVSFQFEFF